MDTSELARRIKKYEAVPKNVLMRRTPVIMRLDGRAFHTFSRNFVKPFDEVLMKAMQDTMKYLCENIQGCVLGYTQSDEITLVLTDYKKFTSEPWFDYEVQKMCSIAAGMATLEFNRKMQMYSRTYADTTSDEKEEKHASALPECPPVSESYRACLLRWAGRSEQAGCSERVRQAPALSQTSCSASGR